MKKLSATVFKVAAILSITLFALGQAKPRATDWPALGNDPGGARYSPLTQINPQNVANLKQAWTYEPGEEKVTAFWQVSPVVVDNVMYISTPNQRIVALDAETGKEIWKFDPENKKASTQRGVAYWPGDAQNPPRIFFGTGDGRLISLDAKTGKPVNLFDDNGDMDLRAGVADKYPNANYYISSSPAFYKNLIILGPRLAERSPDGKGPAGDVRAFDARTGKLVWSFHTLPHPGETGYDTWGPDYWQDGIGPSTWGGITVDEQRGLVFVPTGQPGFGGPAENQAGKNLFGDCVLALDAATGKLRWYYQMIHHDIWDYDTGAPPALVDVVRNGQRTPAVAELTKPGLLFILDRMTGKPVFGDEERPMPQGKPGEAWPTQPFPIKPLPLARNSLTAAEVTKLTPEANQFCTDALKGEKLVPYSLTQPRFPSSIGGGNWGGVAFDPNLGLIFANTNDIGIGPMGGRFVDKDFYPCNQPPWGTLTAVNANTGDFAWRIPLGSYPELEAKGIFNTGAPNLGGPIATASGLVFIGASNDRRFRAFDSRTGKQLWMQNINGDAMATPVTYQGRNGKQYIVVAVAGPGLMNGVGPRGLEFPASLVAFTLP
jgi:glucose dehydrogenase